MASSLRCETCAGDRANASTAPSGTCGRFYRRIGIPERAKAEDAVAAFKSGVLEIEMPGDSGPRGEETHRRNQGLTQGTATQRTVRFDNALTVAFEGQPRGGCPSLHSLAMTLGCQLELVKQRRSVMV